MRRFWIVLIVCAAAELHAQLPQATLSWIFPPGGRAGSTNEVTVSGGDLDDPTGLYFSDARITAVPKQGAPSQFQVVIPAEVPEGTIDVRFVGRYGMSNPRAFAVGTRAETLAAASSNTTAESAIDLPLETIANGRVAASAFNWFRFEAKAGQRSIVRVEARALDSRLVPNLAVIDPSGAELAVARRREWLEFAPPADGSYLLRISDQTFRGGDDYFYRLTITRAPHIEFAVPIVLRRGETNRVTLYGRNLPGAQRSSVIAADGQPLEELPFDVTPQSASAFRKASAAGLDGFEWHFQAPEGSSNPLLFLVGANPVFVASANSVCDAVPPFDLCGLFPSRGEVSGARFSVRKGEPLWFEIVSERLGFPADAHAVLRRIVRTEKGETNRVEQLELEDQNSAVPDRELSTSTRDGGALWVLQEAADCEILVRDLFNSGSGRPQYPYVLSVRPEYRSSQLALCPMPPPRVGDDRRVHALPLTMRRGETMALKAVVRRQGFQGEIEFVQTNLASGLAVASTRIAAGQNVGTVLITASDSATSETNALIHARGVGETNSLSRAALASVVWPVADFNNENATARLHCDPVISVVSSEVAPVIVSVSGPTIIEVAAEGKLVLPLSIVRSGEFQAAFNLKPGGHSALAQAKEIAVPEKATNVSAEINLAEAKLPPGTHTLWLQGNVSGKYRKQPEAVAVAQAELEAAEKVLSSVSGADKPKAEERKKAAEAAKKAAEERAKPRDVTVQVYSRPFVVKVLAKAEEKK